VCFVLVIFLVGPRGRVVLDSLYALPLLLVLSSEHQRVVRVENLSPKGLKAATAIIHHMDTPRPPIFTSGVGVP